jgi:hypothetical protein
MAVIEEPKRMMFARLKKIMDQHCPPLVKSKETENSIEVIGNVATPYGYKKVMVPGMYFASALIRKDNVSFYFFPIYTDPSAFKELAPSAMKQLDGKTCFHFRKEEQLIEKEIKALFKTGITFYKKQGWIK